MIVRPTLLLLFACVASYATAQGTLFDHITSDDGLPAEQILCLHQDAQGFVWIGTENGLARHEGNTIRAFHHDRTDPHSLPNEQVHDIAEDKQGRLWFATAGGLALYRPLTGDFQHFDLEAKGVEHLLLNRIADLLPEPDGLAMWLLTEAGRFRMRIEDGSVMAVEVSEDVTKNGEQHALSMIADEERGGVWFATREGLVFFDRRSASYFHAGNDPHGWGCFATGPVQCPALAPDGALWIFDEASRKLVRCMPGTGVVDTVQAFNPDPIPYGPQFMSFTRDGRLWISTWTYRLLSLDPATGQWTWHRHRKDDPSSLIHTNVKALMEDRDGNLWFGTRQGISLLVPRRQFMRVVPVANDHDISALHALPDGHILIGTRGGGTWINDPVAEADSSGLTAINWVSGADPGLADNGIHCFSPARNGKIHAGISGNLALLDTATRSFSVNEAVVDLVPALRNTSITFIKEDPDGRLWIGTWDQGAFRVSADGMQVQHFGPEEVDAFQLPRNGMLCCIMTADGDLWIGMNGGGGLAHFTHANGPPTVYTSGTDSTGLVNGVVTCLAEAQDGSIWIGTHAGGIDRLDPATERFTHFSYKDGLPGDRVYALAFDHANGLWAATIGGLAYLAAGSPRFVELDLPHGMKEKKINDAFVITAAGEVAFGIGDRLLVVDPARIATSTAPEVRIVSLTYAGHSRWSQPTDAPIELSHEGRSLSIQAGALAFNGTRGLRFSFRIHGMAKDWYDIGHGGRIDLNDLPAGTHAIQVRASVDGVHWSAKPAVVHVNVLPPFWATWWFRTAAIALIASLIFLAFRIYLHGRLTKERERSQREQAVLHERMRIAGDMHDDMGAGLSALKLKSEMALRVEKDPLKREQLSALAGTAGELIGSMRQIIWTMNADQAGLEDLVVYTSSYVRNYGAENDLAVEVSVGGPWPAVALSSEQRRNIFLVVKEALHNVVKHARAAHVRLTMLPEDGLTVELQDDGIGLPSGADMGQGNGLRNMRKRVVALGGSFELRNGHGTVLRFNVPLASSTNQRSIAAAQGS